MEVTGLISEPYIYNIQKVLKAIKKKKIKNKDDAITFLRENNIPFLSCGSTRIVFLNNDKTKVIKVALNAYGVASNAQEYIKSENDFKEAYANVFFKSKKSSILLCEYCKEIIGSLYGINKNGKSVLLDYSNIGID